MMAIWSALCSRRGVVLRVQPPAGRPPLHTRLATPRPAPAQMSAALCLRTFVIKAISALDGQPYALRRVCGRQVRERFPAPPFLSSSRGLMSAQVRQRVALSLAAKITSRL